VCGDAEYEVTACSSSDDAECAVCGGCPAGEYREGCGGSSAGTCESCPSDTYKATSGDGTCTPCQACDIGMFRSGCGGLSPGTCTDVVECGFSDNCDTVATCLDVGGSFTCSCNSGFEGADGTACAPLNQADRTAVWFQARLPYDAALFDSVKQTSYRRAVSRVAGVPIGEVDITAISEAEARRRMLALNVLVDTTVGTDNPGAAARVVSVLKGSQLNAELGRLGLENATLTSLPSILIEEDNPTDSDMDGGAAPIGAIIGGVLGGIAVMGAGLYLYFKMCRHSKDGAQSSNGVVDGTSHQQASTVDVVVPVGQPRLPAGDSGGRDPAGQLGGSVD